MWHISYLYIDSWLSNKYYGICIQTCTPFQENITHNDYVIKKYLYVTHLFNNLEHKLDGPAEIHYAKNYTVDDLYIGSIIIYKFNWIHGKILKSYSY